MKQNFLETIIGIIIICVAIGFLVFAYGGSHNKNSEEYELKATFENVEGIIKGSDVQIGGILIGKVADLKLDTSTYDAILTLHIDKNIKIPSDSRASVSTSGFLGGKYVLITPGGDDKYLEPGDKVKYTQSSINLESLIGKFMYSGSSTKSTDAQKSDAHKTDSQ
ncbi:MAG: outer membrane lipid asymmetry maintenance protein MlaD [Rickettsiaceae bacterium]|nr:outer membrane lipid asymmetry maintenance protein MlaD [Rickettsiaceae bacterium]